MLTEQKFKELIDLNDSERAKLYSLYSKLLKNSREITSPPKWDSFMDEWDTSRGSHRTNLTGPENRKKILGRKKI